MNMRDLVKTLSTTEKRELRIILEAEVKNFTDVDREVMKKFGFTVEEMLEYGGQVDEMDKKNMSTMDRAGEAIMKEIGGQG